MSQQADLATDPVYSEEGISRLMNTDEKHHKQNERKPKRGTRTNFATDLSRKKATGGDSFPVSWTMCSKAHHLDECAEFLKKPLGERRDFIKENVYASVAIVLNTLPSFAEVEDPARPVTRNTQRHFMITTGSQKR